MKHEAEPGLFDVFIGGESNTDIKFTFELVK
jgi:hypothetical protein